MSKSSPARLAALYRYPVKGLSPEPLAKTSLRPKGGVPGDRAYAIENGPSGFDPAAPRSFQKTKFLMLMKNESLASLATRFDDASRRLTITRDSETLLSEYLDVQEGRQAVEAFFDEFAESELRGPTKILSAPGHGFWDRGKPLVSLINLASLDELGGHAGAPVHPLRFRANLYVADLLPWQEFDFVGTRIQIGNVVLKGVDRINRCAAVNVDPETARRDLDLPRTLREVYGHAQCGVYLEVLAGGEIAVGDEVRCN